MNKIIAIVGMCGSGKSIASDLLEELGWTKIYFGGVTYDKMREEGLEITIESERIYREGLRKKYGMGAYAVLLMDKIKEAYATGNTVLDGVYSWEELKILRNEFGDELKVIAVIADRHVRYERLGNRKERSYTRENAVARDIAEIENSAKAGPIAMADFYIENTTSSLANYRKRLFEILEMI